MIRRIVLYLGAVACLLISGSFAQTADELAAEFEHPPQEARPQVWWHWMYGNITEEGITKDLEQLNRLGISGVTQFHNAWVGRGGKSRATPKGPVRFMSPEYQDLVQYALKECDRLGMTMGLHICDGFSQTGGPWVTPETGMRKIQCNVVPVKGGQTQTIKLPEKTVRIIAYPGVFKVPVDEVIPIVKTFGYKRLA